MCGNCWPETGDQSIYFSHVCWETTYKLRPQLSCSSSQVWPARISGVIESVFRCSGPNSKSIVTLTRPAQGKNAPHPPNPLTPPSHSAFAPSFLGHCCHRRLSYWLLSNNNKKKISSRSTIIKTNAVPLNAKCAKSSETSQQKIQRTSEFFVLLSLTVKSKQNRYKEKPYSEKWFLSVKWVLDDGRFCH